MSGKKASEVGAAAFYRAHITDAKCSQDVFRNRVRRGWEYHKALTTPTDFQWGVATARVYERIVSDPGVTRAALDQAFPSRNTVQSALVRLLNQGRIVKRVLPKLPGRGGLAPVAYFPTSVPYETLTRQQQTSRRRSSVATDTDRAWTPKPYVHPIRRAFLNNGWGQAA